MFILSVTYVKPFFAYELTQQENLVAVSDEGKTCYNESLSQPYNVYTKDVGIGYLWVELGC